MTVATTNTEFDDADWHEVATGAGEFQIELTQDGRYALGADEPAEGVIGHKLIEGIKVPIDLPADIGFWVRVPLTPGGAYKAIVTPGQ